MKLELLGFMHGMRGAQEIQSYDHCSPWECLRQNEDGTLDPNVQVEWLTLKGDGKLGGERGGEGGGGEEKGRGKGEGRGGVGCQYLQPRHLLWPRSFPADTLPYPKQQL